MTATAGRAIAGALTAIMTGVAYATSAEMAKERGPFARFMENREPMLRVIRNHRRAAHGEHVGYEKLATAPTPLDHAACPDKALIAARRARLGDRARSRASFTAIATRRSPSSRRPAPSASSWIATPPASSPISRW